MGTVYPPRHRSECMRWMESSTLASCLWLSARKKSRQDSFPQSYTVAVLVMGLLVVDLASLPRKMNISLI